MLAGRMKLRNFAILAGLLVAGGITAFALTYEPAPDPPAPTQPALPRQSVPAAAHPVPRPMETPRPVAAIEPPVAGEDAITTHVRGMAGRKLSSGKGKDVTSGRAYKVNLYQDDGFTEVNRAKIDLNRNDKWDEKWTFDAGRITRQIAPADDENYTKTLIFEGGAWKEE